MANRSGIYLIIALLAVFTGIVMFVGDKFKIPEDRTVEEDNIQKRLEAQNDSLKKTNDSISVEIEKIMTEIDSVKKEAEKASNKAKQLQNAKRKEISRIDNLNANDLYGFFSNFKPSGFTTGE